MVTPEDVEFRLTSLTSPEARRLFESINAQLNLAETTSPTIKIDERVPPLLVNAVLTEYNKIGWRTIDKCERETYPDDGLNRPGGAHRLYSFTAERE